MARKDDGFKDHVLDQLADLGGVEARAMFGGHGLYRDGLFFGIVYKGRLYFKTNEKTRSAYAKHGMKPFRPKPGMTLKTYYEVPGEVLDDRRELEAWAAKAVGGSRTN